MTAKTKTKAVVKRPAVRRTQRWLREEFALWAALDSAPALPEAWFPELPFDGGAADSDDGDEDIGGKAGAEGLPTPGDDAQEPGDEGDADQPGDGEGEGDGEGDAGGGQGEGDGDGDGEGDEGAGGDQEQADAEGAAPQVEPAPEPPKLTPRGTTFRPADAEDHGTVFAHFCGKTEDGGRLYRREFSSVQDFISQPFANSENLNVFRQEMLDDDTGTWRSWKKQALRGFTRKTDLTWYGAESGDLAADRAIHGWAEGAERVRKLLADVEAPQPVSVKRKLRRGDQGDELDIHAVYRGALDRAWTRRQRTGHRSRMTVRLVVQLGGSQAMEQEQMFWRGAAIAKLNELLEDAGYGVELMCFSAEHLDGHEDETHQLFCLKDAGTPLNLDQVAGVVCNAGFFRTWCFRGTYAITEHTIPKVDLEETLLGRSYCYNVDPLEHPEYRLGADGTPTFVVPVGVCGVESAREFINEALAKLAADVQEAA